MGKKYFITGSKAKYNEIAEYFSGLEQLEIEGLNEIQSLDINEIIKHKLIISNSTLNLMDALFLVEDTGLYLKALNNFPGPLIKFLLQSIDNEGIFNLCDKLDEFEAYATTVFGLLNSSTNQIGYYSGTIKGTISLPRGNYGFGWDPIFIPEGANKTFAEMETIEEKNIYSMRYKALQKLLDSFNNK